MKLGTNDISSVYLGTNAVSSIYLGTNLVYSAFSSGLLDTYTGAAAAYSLRRLSIAYTGSAIRVRRADNNAEQDIGFIGEDLDTSALTSFCSGTNGFVKTWYDQSGNGRDATQTTVANQPQIVNSGSVILENGKPSVYFNNGSLVCMNFTAFSTVNLTYLWVSKKDSTSGNGSIVLSGARNGSQWAGDDVDNAGNPNINGVGNIVRTTLNNTSSSGGEVVQHLAYINRRNSTEAVGQYNDSNNAYNNSVSSANSTIDSIANYGFGYNYVGKLQEILIYTNDQSANRAGISSNINDFYSIY